MEKWIQQEKQDPDTSGPAQSTSSAWVSEMVYVIFFLFFLFFLLFEVFNFFYLFCSWGFYLLLILRYFKSEVDVLPFFSFSLSLIGAKHKRPTCKALNQKKIKPVKDNKLKGREVDISWCSSPCTHSQRIFWHMHMKGSQYEHNVLFHFQFLQKEMVTLREKRNGLDMRGKCRVILSLLVVSVAHLGYSCLRHFSGERKSRKYDLFEWYW